MLSTNRAMTKWTLCLLALAAMTISANAESRGLKNGNIGLHYTGEVLSGQMDNFKQFAGKVIAAVAQEPGALMYEWSFRPDQKTFDVVELYQDSDAVIAHVKHVIGDFGKEFGQVQKGVGLVVYGSPSEQLKQAIADFKPEYQTYIGGFVK